MDRPVEQTVRTLLAVAGISADDEALAELTRVYPVFRAALDTLYTVPEARYESPAPVFRASGTYVDWHDARLSVSAANPSAKQAAGQ
jgi:hypothetical protein